MRISDWSSDVCSSDLPVVTVFTAGIAVISASSQVKDFLGLAMPQVPADFLPKWAAYGTAIGTIQPATLAIGAGALRSEEHTSELQSLMRISYAVFCLKTKKKHNTTNQTQLLYRQSSTSTL